MGFFDKLFNPSHSFPLKSDNNNSGSNGLWQGIPSTGVLLGRSPDTLRLFEANENTMNNQSRLLLATAESIHTISQLQMKGESQGLLVFSLMNEPAIVCYLKKDVIQNDILSIDSCIPELKIESFTLETYPLLSISLSWISRDSYLDSIEITPDICDCNIQSFLTNFFTIRKVWIFLISAEDKLPICTLEGNWDQKRIDHYKTEVQNVIHHYHVIPKNKLNYQKAVLAYPKPTWRRPSETASSLVKNVNTQKPDLIPPEIKGLIFEVSPVDKVIIDLKSEEPKMRCNALDKINEVRIVGEKIVSDIKTQHSRLVSVDKITEFVIPRYEAQKAIPALLNLLNDADANVRESVAKALDSLEWSPRSEMERIHYLYAKHDFTGLSKEGYSAVELLMQSLNDEPAHVRWESASALGLIGDKRAITILMKKLEDIDSGVRSSAASALGMIGDPCVVDSLIQTLNDPDDNVRSSAADALGKFSQKDAIQALIIALNDKTYFVTVKAALSLGKIGDASAVDSLIGLLNGTDSDIQVSAAEALGMIRDKKALNPLKEHLGDRRYKVKEAVKKAIELIEKS